MRDSLRCHESGRVLDTLTNPKDVADSGICGIAEPRIPSRSG